ncbi:Sec-independent protein translocase TatB [Microbacterium protaetiae]|uniref:Sec-independent protein translocase TatB n=1 Tax=Microbacterium protaetiae TaxID=2509458 RepID=A0A4V0YDK4_9MICO|nr:Sec-independent protein translocase TatB [Microbacterium protaetiae]QAY61021.1 Sec-independent protein translocase TatB [Microbacterium protaetiae]
MIFGLTFEKLLVIGVIAALLLGPDRLPKYAEMLARAVKRGRELLGTAKERMQDELGDDVDWRTLDPRQYDPRRIIREALLDDTPARPAAPAAPAPVAAQPEAFRPGTVPPFDSEAT